MEELSWYVDNTVAKRLLSVEGMAQVRRGGGVTREIRVILDPAKMQAFGITAAQVNQQLRQTNINAAGGPRPDRRRRAIGARARQRPGRL